MNNTGVLFDLDGVLIDSESRYTEFWRAISRIYPTGIEDFAIHIKGTTLPSIMKYFPDADVQADILQRINEFQRTMEYPLFDGAEEFLVRLAEHGIPCAIVTSSDDRKMASLYRQHPGFKDHFAVVIDASQVTRSKPDPQGYLLGAEALGIDIKDCYVFEDSLQGLEAARRSGATVIGICTTYPRHTLEGRADELIDTIADITVTRMLQVRRG